MKLPLRNLIEQMNTCAVPLTNYSTTFLYCKKAEIQGTDWKRKKILKKCTQEAKRKGLNNEERHQYNNHAWSERKR